MTNDRYDLINYNKWNRKLMNLYWLSNVIILTLEVFFCFCFFSGLLSYVPVILPDTLSEYLKKFIIIPSSLMFLITILCEAIVKGLQKNYKNIQPYVITFTSVAYCAVLIAIHYNLKVIYVTTIMPVIFSLAYDNKRVLLCTFIFSFIVFCTTFWYLTFFSFLDMRRDYGEVITASAILLIVYLLGRTILSRFREIIDTLLKTERAAYESEAAKTRAEASAEARTRFLAHMSHEIRTPMNGIIGLTELAIDDYNVPDKQRDYLLKIRTSASGLLDIINDILDLSKIDAGEFTVEEIPFNLNRVFDECRSVIAPKAKEKNLALYVQDETNLCKKVIGDPTKLRQAILNLLSNAVKFTSKGAVSFYAKCEEKNESSVKIHFEVVDTGIGITTEKYEKIFEPFKQADESTTRKFGGTGLGLAITKNIVELMGGNIRVKSSDGMGSTFSFTLPFVLSDEAANAEGAFGLDMTKASPIFKGYHVLLCEDNPTNQLVAAENLAKLGFKVTIAENGKRCVNIVDTYMKANKTFDIILMDIHMPVMDGFQAVKALKELNVQVPIIAMTANVMKEDREKYISAGMSCCVSKPFRIKELLDCLLKFLTPVKEPKYADKAISPVDTYDGVMNCAGSKELYMTVLTRFLRDEPDRFFSMKKAYLDGDMLLAAEIAHASKSVAATIGAAKLAEYLALFEKSMKNVADSLETTLLDDIYNEIIDVLKYISEVKI